MRRGNVEQTRNHKEKTTAYSLTELEVDPDDGALGASKHVGLTN